MSYSLDGMWKVTHFPYNADISMVLEPDFVPEGWLNARIPEDIHATLRRAGAIRGNTYNKREEEDQWIEQKDWVYHKTFYAPDSLRAQRVTLCFEGLDTFCDVYLNAEMLGSHQNMHTPCEFDIGGRLRYGACNWLVVRFFSPVEFVKTLDDRGIFSITTSDRILARKAQMNYSWDFCARCVTTGIWKPVSIRRHTAPEIDSYYLRTLSLAEGSAALGLTVELCAPGCEPFEDCRVSVSLSSEGETAFCWEGTPEEARSLTFSVENPRLWWPRPYGQPHLYDFVLSLSREGQLLDQRRQRFGIRTIEVIQEAQADGKSFQFAVNAKRLFIRGANWVPINTVYTDITRRDYEVLIHAAVKGNLSMLRIWGGGIYEPPAFFELCDENGILVWSDFMLSCGIYPQNQAFLDEMAREAEYVLKTYRNSTCLAIWAGDNENGQAYGWAGRPYEFENDRISNEVLKQACRRLDPHRYYLPTSPASPDPSLRGGDNPSSPYQGDLHLYIMSADPGVNANRDYGKDYYKRVLGFKPRFMSEFGFISLPEKDSYYRFNHRREPLRNPQELIKFLPFTKAFLDRGDIDKVIYFSQVFNASALKYWIEYFRSLKGICSGSLYWKFNDPLADCPDAWMYPSHMCAIDMYLSPKMTYYYTRRAYEDVLVALTETADGWNVHVCNETDAPIAGRLRISHRSFAGDELTGLSMPASAAADAATLVCALPADRFTARNRFGEYILVTLDTGDQLYENRYFFADLCEINRLQLPQARLRIADARLSGAQLKLWLRTEGYARNVRINLMDVRADYSDNYFDMDAGAERCISIDLWEAGALRDRVVYIEGENVERLVLPLASVDGCGEC
jgi:beta-mannosidase